MLPRYIKSWFFNAKNHAVKGFTLIEVLIVLGCLIALSAALYPTADNFMSLSKVNAAKNGAAAIATAINQYNFEIAQYPDNLSDLTTAQGQYGPWTTAATLKDPWNKNYNYTFNEAERSFAVWSSGQNGRNESGANVSTGFSGDDIGIIQ